MEWLPLFSVGSPFLRAPGRPGKCELCDRGAEMSQEKSLPFLQQAWEAATVLTTLEGETPHTAQRFLLFLPESFRKRNTAALALLWFFHHGPTCGSTPLLSLSTFHCTKRSEEHWGLSVILSNLGSPSAVACFPPLSLPSPPLCPSFSWDLAPALWSQHAGAAGVLGSAASGCSLRHTPQQSGLTCCRLRQR